MANIIKNPQGGGGSVSGDPRTFAGFDNSGDLYSIPGWNFEQTYQGLQFDKNVTPDNNGGASLHTFNNRFNPLQDSVAENWNLFNIYTDIDNELTGFDFGTGGNALRYFNLSFNHQGLSDIGEINFFTQGFQMGNGTDPIDVNGFSYMLGFGQFADNVNISGPMQGYGFQVNVASGATTSDNCSVNAFYDFANIATAIQGYNSFIANPIVDTIKTNSNFVAYNSAPQIETFEGNAGCFGFAFSPILGTFDTGSFNAISISPTIDFVPNATGLYINMNNVTGTNIKAIDVVGDVSIQGDLSFTGALALGQLNAFYSINAIDGGGNPTGIHGLTSEVIGLANTTTNNCDAIGVNTAMLMRIEENSINNAGPFELGFAALALPCVVETHTGSYVSNMSGAVYAINLVGSATGGTIDELNLCRVVVIPNGITTINKTRGFFYDELFGSPGGVRHAFYNGYDAETYLLGGVKIGGTPISDDTVVNSSVALEIASTTKAFLVSRMSTAEKNLLTAVDGMIIYDTTLGKFQGYEAGSWISLV